MGYGGRIEDVGVGSGADRREFTCIIVSDGEIDRVCFDRSHCSDVEVV